MKVLKFDNEQDWLDARLGRITGTRLKDLVSSRGTKPKIGFYELIAERIALPPTNENAMYRGKRIEQEAIERFAEETGKKVNTELVLWCRDDDENIAVSPDGHIGKTEAAECKCLSSARHLEAWMTKDIPSEYEYQVLQYFIVNNNLKKLYFVFYDPRMPIDLFWIEVTRKEVAERVAEYLELERKVLAQVKEVERKITF